MKIKKKKKINFNLNQTMLYKELNKVCQNPKSYIQLIEAEMKTLKKIMSLKRRIQVYKFKN